MSHSFKWVLLAGCLILGIDAFASDYVPGEVIIKMKGRAGGSKSAAFMGKMQGKLALKASFGGLGIHHMALKPGDDIHKVIDELRNDPDVEYAEPNYILRRFDGEVAGADARKFTVDEAASLVAQNYAQGSYSQSSADTKVTQAWSQMTSGLSEIPIVAIIDSGVDYNHTVFTSTGAIWQNPGEIGTDSLGRDRSSNGVDDDGNGFVDDHRGWNFHANNNSPMDDDDHGTHVAGIVLGVTQDLFAGTLAPAKIRIMPLKFLGADGSGSTSSAISAIYYAVNNGASVINNSWGGGSYSQSLHDALAYAYSNSVVLVAAAGNSSNNNDSNAMYPANYAVPSQISVAATSDWDSLASFSNYGMSTVHMAAPGVGIYSTVPGNYYRYMSGTSMAAPFVAGLAALAVREAPQLSGYQIKNLVINSAKEIGALVPKTISGSRADGLRTVVNAKTSVGVGADQPVYVASAPSSYRSPDSVQSKGGCGLVSSKVASQYINRNGPRGPDTPIGMVVGLLLIPLLVWQLVQMKQAAASADSAKNRRAHERFVMNSEIKVRMGDRELVGQMNTISLGGLSFKADAMLEKGGVVTVQIASPDGGEQVQVEGRIVWSEQNKAYGVQFGETKEGVATSIRTWTKGLMKAS